MPSPPPSIAFTHRARPTEVSRFKGHFSARSALKAYQKATGHDPLPDLRDKLAAAWISLDTAKTIKWPLSVRLGHI
jgi:hypothetical protein